MDRRATRLPGARPRSPGIGPSPPAALCSRLPLPARRPFGAVRVFMHRPGTHHARRRRHSRRHLWRTGERRWRQRSSWAARSWCPTTRPIPTLLPHHRRPAARPLSRWASRAAGPSGRRRGRQPRPHRLRRGRGAQRRRRGRAGRRGRRERHGARSRRRRPRRGARRGRRHASACWATGSASIYPAANRGLYERHGRAGPAADRVSARASGPTRAASPGGTG